MHPRNPYKTRPPDFKELALEYPEFRKYCQYISNGKVKFDFQNDDAIRCLTRTLLKKDFGLEVNLPPGNLVPRIPQKLNYCLLIDDLLKENKIQENVIGIDIGTGTSCVHALIGARKFGWKFVATDGDEHSVKVAHENVAKNGLEQEICVVRVNPDVKTVLMDVMNTLHPSTFTFCMCNPPFFGTEEKLEKFMEENDDKYSNRIQNQNSNWNSEFRPPPHSITLASSAELSVEGGEVAFVNRIIDDSVCLRERIKIYTTMLGRKQSIKPLSQRLQRFGDDVKYVVFPLNQGKTKRWMLAWTFGKNITLSMNTDRPITLKCPAPGLTRILNQMTSLHGVTRIEDVGRCHVEFKSVTWTNQRARRRAEAELKGNEAKRARLNCRSVACEANMGCGDGTDSYTNSGNFTSSESTSRDSEDSGVKDNATQCYFPLPAELVPKPIIRIRVLVEKLEKHEDLATFELISGSRQHLSQLVQFLKNSICR